MDKDSLVYLIKTEGFYADIENDVEERLNTSGYVPDRQLPIGKNKEVIGLMKDELGSAIMTEFVSLRPKLYSCKKVDGSEDKTCTGNKKCVVKITLTFEDYKNCLFEYSTEYRGRQAAPDPCGVYRSQLTFRSMKHEIFTLEVNKVALNKDDDKHIA